MIPLGRHRLRDLNRPEEVWQVAATDLRTAFPALVSLDSFATNLPIALTPLIGRTDELAAVGDVVRIKTPGDACSGLPVRAGSARPVWRYKSAADAVDAFSRAVGVELATVDHGERVAEAIAMALGLPEAARCRAHRTRDRAQ